MGTTLYWHDSKPSGKTRAGPGIAQFAGIRTDEDLKEIGEPLMVYCQPPQDTIRPGRLPDHRPHHSIADSTPAGPPVRQSGRCLAGPAPAVSVSTTSVLTTNSLASCCTAISTIPTSASGRTAIPAGICWMCCAWRAPCARKALNGLLMNRATDDETERLMAANGIEHAGAHDALVDVRATIAMARLLKTRATETVRFCFPPAQ